MRESTGNCRLVTALLVAMLLIGAVTTGVAVAQDASTDSESSTEAENQSAEPSDEIQLGVGQRINVLASTHETTVRAEFERLAFENRLDTSPDEQQQVVDERGEELYDRMKDLHEERDALVEAHGDGETGEREFLIQLTLLTERIEATEAGAERGESMADARELNGGVLTAVRDDASRLVGPEVASVATQLAAHGQATAHVTVGTRGLAVGPAPGEEHTFNHPQGGTFDQPDVAALEDRDLPDGEADEVDEEEGAGGDEDGADTGNVSVDTESAADIGATVEAERQGPNTVRVTVTGAATEEPMAEVPVFVDGEVARETDGSGVVYIALAEDEDATISVEAAEK